MELKNGRLPTVVTQDEMIFVSLQNGAINCQAILFDCCEPVEQVSESLDCLSEDDGLHCENDQVLQMNFKPYALLDYLVDGHALYGNRKVLSSEARPCIEQLRKELQDMINEIDGLSYQ